jgi:hypothetical protein
LGSGSDSDHVRFGWRNLPHSDHAHAALLERERFGLGSWGSAFDWLSLGS